MHVVPRVSLACEPCAMLYAIYKQASVHAVLWTLPDWMPTTGRQSLMQAHLLTILLVAAAAAAAAEDSSSGSGDSSSRDAGLRAPALRHGCGPGFGRQPWPLHNGPQGKGGGR